MFRIPNYSMFWRNIIYVLCNAMCSVHILFHWIYANIQSDFAIASNIPYENIHLLTLKRFNAFSVHIRQNRVYFSFISQFIYNTNNTLISICCPFFCHLKVKRTNIIHFSHVVHLITYTITWTWIWQ